MSHVLEIKPAVTETLRFKIKELLEENGYIYHSGYTDPTGDTQNLIIFSQQSAGMTRNTPTKGVK